MRRSLSAKERLRLFTLHGGICHLCAGRIDGSREAWEVEHVLALALGGADDDANRKPAHVKCHRPKTADDIGKIAKADRIKAKHTGARKRGWGGKWKRKLNGETVLRDATDG